MTEPVKRVAAKNQQATAARRLTREMFQDKKPHEEELKLMWDGALASVLFRSIGRKSYDKLVTECPPSTKQKAEGLDFDRDKLAPILMSRVIVDPQLSEVEWRNIWNDENWNRAETGDFFYKAVEVCSTGLSAAPTETD